ncbi:MAG: hypothetical protein R6V49_03455 [Bacteroidales bacterium]
MKSSILLLKSAVIIIVLTAAAFRDFTPTATIPIAADRIISDNLGNLFAITGNTIKKYNSQGVFQAEFSLKKVDRFNDADASDPLKILLFSRNSGEIFRIDNKMTQQGNSTNLFNAGLVSPMLACNSYDNGAWIWDNALNELLRINQNGHIDQRSENLAGLIPGNPGFTMLLEKDFLLFASSPEYGILVFDRAASYVKTIPINIVNYFQILSGKIIYPLENKLHFFDTRTLTETLLTLPDSASTNALIEGETLFIHQKDSVKIYTTKHTL